MEKLLIPCSVGQVSDGFHTFDELYDHRCLLFLALMQSHPEQSWFSWLHSDGGSFQGWFIAGINLNGKQISYHLHEKYWNLACQTEAELRERAPEWDGHTSDDVLNRISEGISQSLFNLAARKKP